MLLSGGNKEAIREKFNLKNNKKNNQEEINQEINKEINQELFYKEPVNNDEILNATNKVNYSINTLLILTIISIFIF